MILLSLWFLVPLYKAEPRWTEALVLPNAPNATVPNPVYAKLDVGATEFNRLFHTSDHIIRRGCPRCSYGNHETLYYRRLTNVSSFDVYGSMISWQSKDNTMAVDFNLYSTLGDAINNTNPFTFCNFNGTTSYGGPVGGFRDCGVTAKEDYNWCSADVGVDADRECKYWILNTATDAPTQTPTETTASPTEPRWTPALVLPNAPNATVPDPVYAKLDVGLAEFNRLFHSSDHIIRRDCPRCSYGNHETMYYRRLTNVSSFDVYGSMISWQSKDNTQNVDFNLYSSLDDAINNMNAWTFCNYNGTTSYGGAVGAFRDCGVIAKEDYNWCSADVGVDADRECKYWILNAVTYAPTAETLSPTEPTLSPTETTASPTETTASPTEPRWTEALVLPNAPNATVPDPVYAKLDVGLAEFNRLFHSSDHIIRRECPNCAYGNMQTLYYRRLTNVSTFDVYGSMISWQSKDNTLAVDFNLYSTLDDAINNMNAWTFCNYNGTTSYGGPVGAFRDCGPIESSDYWYNWCSADVGQWADRECKYWILNAVTYAPTAETLSPTEPTVSPTEPRWTEALVLPNAPNATVPNPVYAKLDVGATEFNRLFHSSTHIIRRECPRCSYGNMQTVYYRRLTNVSTFDVYGSMISWQSKDNTQNVDFNLYSSLDDAINNMNAFAFCNYNGTTSYGGPVGAFRDCGVTAKEDYNWCSADVGVDADRECKYWILNAVTYAPTADTLSPTEPPVAATTEEITVDTTELDRSADVPGFTVLYAQMAVVLTFLFCK